jgi:tetratricopeptide (TPR) repeat protein
MNMKRRYAFLAFAVGLFIYAARGATTEAEQDRINQAMKLIDERNPVAALEILEYLLRENTALPGARYQAALAAQLSGDSTKALSLAAQALERKEETSELQVLIGVLAMQDKKYPEAEQAFARAVELEPSNGVALYNLSEALREQGRAQDAIGILEQTIKLEPQRKLLLLKLHLARMESGKGSEEIEAEVISRQIDSEQTWDWLMTTAAVHLKNGNYRQASDAIRAAKEIAGSRTIGPIVAEDHFFRQFTENERLKDVRNELGLE